MAQVRTTKPSCTPVFGLGADVLKPYKIRIDRWLSPDLLKNQSVSASKAKKAITDYKNAIGQPEGLAELMVFYCERASDFSNALGFADEAYFSALVKMFEQAFKISITLENEQRHDLLDRLDNVRSISHSLGYGVGDKMNILLAEYKDDIWAQFCETPLLIAVVAVGQQLGC
jgi:hypothetical protein